MKANQQLIEEYINLVPKLSDEDLVYYYKCSSSDGSKLFKPLLLAIEKERKKRNKTPIKELDNETEEVPEIQ